METNAISKRTAGFGLALAIACLANAAIVVIKEKSDAVMNAFKTLAGHHWTAHSVVVLALFVAGGLTLSRREGVETPASACRLLTTIISAVAVSTLTIIGFYLFVD